MRSLICAALMSLFFIATAEAQVYNHNGSTVRMIWGEGDGFSVYYMNPRPGLPVSPGTLLFSGASPADGSIYGTAYIFSSRCGPIGYQVRGSFIGDGNDFQLQGAAPIRNNNCTLVRYEWNGNSNLYFSHLY